MAYAENNALTARSPAKKSSGMRNTAFQRKIVLIKKNRQLYLIILLPLVWLFIFRYVPMYGAQIAFRDFRAVDGIWGSEWAGLKHFLRFFGSYQFRRIITNTLRLSLYRMIVGFPFPILLAIALHHAVSRPWKKTVQLVTYLPYFISTVVLVGMVLQFLSPRGGFFNNTRALFGMRPIDFIAQPALFPSIYVWSGIWQEVGWGSIIFLAALSAIDPLLHEAAIIDGATRWNRVWHIDLPGITPTIVIILIMSTGAMMQVGFEKAFLLQNDLNLRTSEVIQTYVYKVGLGSAITNFSYASAIGFFNSLVNLALMVTVNTIARRVSDTSLW